MVLRKDAVPRGTLVTDRAELMARGGNRTRGEDTGAGTSARASAAGLPRQALLTSTDTKPIPFVSQNHPDNVTFQLLKAAPNSGRTERINSPDRCSATLMASLQERNSLRAAVTAKPW